VFWRHAVQEKDWRKALDFMIQSLRDILVFDNLAIFIIDKQGETSEIAYARALGREKKRRSRCQLGRSNQRRGNQTRRHCDQKT
jgi:hypothetical protein